MKKLLVIFTILFFTSTLSISQTWIQSLNGRNVWSLAKDPQGNVFAGGLTGVHSRIWKSTNAGNTWDTIFIGAGQTMWDFAFDSQGSIYVANFSNGLLKSTNNGASFSVTPITFFNNKNLQGVKCGSTGSVYVTTSMGFFRSTDYGVTFNETALTGFNCLPVLVDKDSTNIVYVGVSSGAGTGIGFYRSSDSGQSFSVNLNPGKNGYNLFQKFNGDLFMITTTSPYNLDKSTDKGLSWTTLGNVPNAPRGITITGRNEIYTGGNGGVFRSTNEGSSFSNHNFTLSTTPVIATDYLGVVKIFIGTTGAANGGVWSYDAYLQSTLNLTINHEAFSVTDTITVELRSTVSPFNLVESRTVLGGGGISIPVQFSNAVDGVNYYIVVKHRNSVETWSKSGGEVFTAGILTYDFTSAASQAYGNNQVLVGSDYSLFTGDVDQNDVVNLIDIITISNDAVSFVTGFVVTDLNYDTVVNLTDMLYASNNFTMFITTKRP